MAFDLFLYCGTVQANILLVKIGPQSVGFNTKKSVRSKRRFGVRAIRFLASRKISSQKSKKTDLRAAPVSTYAK